MFADAEVVRVMATSKDGTRVPMNIIRRKGTVLNGRNPTLLTGYGGYGVSITPNFLGTHRMWLEQGGVIVVEGNGFSNNLTQYDDFVPGSLMRASAMEPFSFDVDKFDITWLMSGPRKGMAQKFVANLTYRETPDGEEKTYPLRVNHPLSIGGTDVFLIGHGYAPRITVRDGV